LWLILTAAASEALGACLFQLVARLITKVGIPIFEFVLKAAGTVITELITDEIPCSVSEIAPVPALPCSSIAPPPLLYYCAAWLVQGHFIIIIFSSG
jgi:hypothetical protein